MINKINIQSQSVIDKVLVKNILGQDLFELSPNLKDFEIDFSEVTSGTIYCRYPQGIVYKLYV